MSILEEILSHKRIELERAQAAVAPDEMARSAGAALDPPRGFRAALCETPKPRVVAEIKRRSPSRGEIRANFDPVGCAKGYAEGGAAAISVLTDAQYFGGHLDFLGLVRRSVSLPLLRKDFVIDGYQIDEARVHGADAVLLIASALTPETLGELRQRAVGLGLDTLVEVHDEAELEVALAAGADLIGVNSRDLRTFAVDLGVAERIIAALPAGVVAVAESGIFTAEDVARVEAAGADAVLVGEALMREEDVGAALRRLRRTS